MQSGVHDGLRRIADALPEIAVQPLIVLVDQLEEVFTLCEDSTERSAFIGNLLCAAGDHAQRVSVIVTLRSDFLGATQQYPQLNQLIAPQGYFVAAMAAEGLQEAISKPAELAGHPLDPGTVNLLIEQTEGREGALPLLQFALTRIWAGLVDGKEPAETLGAIGGVGGALAGEAQRIYESLSPAEQEIARRVFLGLVQLGEGTQDTRRRVALARVVAHRDSLEQVQRVIARFANPGARLITLAADGGTETAEVTHEALFEHWQQLQDWLDRSRSDLRFQRRLDEAAAIWVANGRAEGNLWRSPDLDLLRQFQGRSGNDMTPLQVEFFEAAVKATEKRERERRRQRLVLMSVLGGGLILTSGASIVALFQLQQAQRQRVEQLAATAEALLASQPVDATIHAIAAAGLSQSALVQFLNQPQFISVQESLLNVIRENPERNRFIHKDDVTSIAFSPNCKRIVSVSGNTTLQLWDAKSGQPINAPFTNNESPIISAAFSPDGKRIVTGGHTVQLWDASSGQPLGKPFVGHEANVWSVAFSPDGKRIVSGSVDQTVRLWDASTGQPIGQPFSGHTEIVASVAFSPDGKRIISGSFDNTVRLWDASTGKPIGRPFTGHEDDVWSVAFSPDGKRIVSGSQDNTVRLWDASIGQPIGQPFTGHEGLVWSVAFNPDGTHIVSGSFDSTVRLWDVSTGQSIGQPFRGHDSAVYAVAFSTDGKYIISGSRDHTMRLWNVSVGPPISQSSEYPQLSWSEGKRGVFFYGGNLLGGNKLRLWTASSGQQISQTFTGHVDSVNSVAFSPDGKRIVSGSGLRFLGDGNTLRVWDVSSRQQIGKTFTGHVDSVNSVAFSPDGKRIVSGSDDTTVRVWDVSSGRQIDQIFIAHRDSVNSVAFSPDGKRIVSGSRDHTIRVWDASSGQQIGKTITDHKDDVNSVAFSPDGKRIVSGSQDHTIRVWDASSGQQIGQPLTGHENSVTSVAFSPDGQHIISGSWDNTVRLWDASTGQPIGQPFAGHEGIVWSVAFNPDGTHIVSSSLDNTVRLWDVSTGQPIGQPFNGHDSAVHSVAFSPYGKRIVSGSGDETVQVWNISWQHLLQLACTQLRHHPSLIQATTDIAKEAQHTCEQYVWNP